MLNLFLLSVLLLAAAKLNFIFLISKYIGLFFNLLADDMLLHNVKIS